MTVYLNEREVVCAVCRGETSQCVRVAKTFTYIGLHDVTDGGVKLLRVIEVHGDDVRPADVLLRIGMLRGHLRNGAFSSQSQTSASVKAFYLYRVYDRDS